MTIKIFGGAETPLFDLYNNDGENFGGGGSVTLASGVLRSGSAGAKHYHCSMSSSGAGGKLTIPSVLSGAGATKQIMVAIFQLTHAAGTAFDTPIFNSSTTPAIEIRDSRLTDGKIHLYVGGTEIDSANAFAPAVGSAFGLYLEVQLGTPYAIKLYYDSTAGGTFVAKQSGTGASGQALGGGGVFGENLAKGVNHNWALDVDDFYMQDNGGSFNATLPDITKTTISDPAHVYRDVVLEGRPNGVGTDSVGWKNAAGTTCVTGGANCYVDVSDVSDATYIKYIGDPAGGFTVDRELFPTSSLVLGSSDLVYAMRLASRVRAVTLSGDTLNDTLAYGGSFFEGGATFPSGVNPGWLIASAFTDSAPDGTAWTATSAKGTQIGARAIAVNTGVANDVEFRDQYKIVLIKPQAAAVGFAHSFGAII